MNRRLFLRTLGSVPLAVAAPPMSAQAIEVHIPFTDSNRCAELYLSMIKSGVMTLNQVRAMENLC